MTAESKVLDILGGLPVHICQPGKFLPLFCNVTFEFSRQSPEFCLNRATIPTNGLDRFLHGRIDNTLFGHILSSV